ncbi:glycosyltransferase family 2 protein [Agromyces sp. NPDC058110]|uniref:glycosyltransferase family 2 protein n=1 Tax=Agromyces sp. NPDC058110 TaxID=3346345 RepID=UPI0036D9D995
MNAPRTPTLSVIIPTHDVATWIEETLESVLAQHVPGGLEVLVVDDHSTDRTVALVESIAASDPRVRLVRATARGGGSARNAGVAAAHGRYVAFCDGDDLVPDGAYAALLSSLEASGSDLAFGDYLKFSPTRTWRPTGAWPAYERPGSGFAVADRPSLLFGRACWNKVFRRDFWDAADLSFPDVPRSNDIVPMTRAYLAARSVDLVEDVVYLYRERLGTGSMTSRASSAESIISYLEQELSCAELIARSGADPLRSAHASLIVERDGWVHFAGWLRASERDAETDERVVSLFARLLASSGRGIDSMPSSARRATLTLALTGALRTASLHAAITSGKVVSTDGQITAWQRVITAACEEGVRLDETTELVEGSVESIARALSGDGPVGVDEVADLVDLVAEKAGTASLAVLPEFKGIAFDRPAEVRRRIGELASHPAAPIVRLRTGRRIEAVVARGAHAVLLDETDDRLIEFAHRDPDTGVHRIAVRDLPIDHRLRLAVRDDDRIRTARPPASTSEYSRFDGVLYHFDRRGLTLSRRRHWVARAGRAVTPPGVRRRLAAIARRGR